MGTHPSRWPVVAGTGHRELPDDAVAWLTVGTETGPGKLVDGIRWLRDERATTTVVSGLALGFDQLLADAVLEHGDGLQLWVFIPFEEQAARWIRAQRARWAELRAAAHREVVCGVLPIDLPPAGRSKAVNRLLWGRDDRMLHEATAVMSYWDGRLTGGTHGTLLKAVERGMPGVRFNPAARRAEYLPVLDRLVPAVLYHRDCGCVADSGSLAAMSELAGRLARAGHRQWRVRREPSRRTGVGRGGQRTGCARCAADSVRVASVPK